MKNHSTTTPEAQEYLCATCTLVGETECESHWNKDGYAALPDDESHVTACPGYIRTDEGAGPTGEAACEGCDHMLHIRQRHPYGDTLVTEYLDECEEGFGPPSPGHYCEHWRAAYTREDYLNDEADRMIDDGGEW